MSSEALKQALVDAIRMLERAEYIDHNGHASARRDEASFFINSGASVRSALTTADIVAVDFDGNLVEGSAKPPLEFHLHAAVYRARPDAGAVVHTHPKWSTFLSMTGTKYQPVYAQGVLLGEVPVLDSPMSVNTRAMGERLAATLGGGPAALLKAHGAVAVGADVLEAFTLAAYLEENAYRQYMAMQVGTPYVFSEAEQREAAVACALQEDVGSLLLEAEMRAGRQQSGTSRQLRSWAGVRQRSKGRLKAAPTTP
jgi:ribulose-5-phosphate 4-epimerase/fuculose-1-phosphate aldolase